MLLGLASGETTLNNRWAWLPVRKILHTLRAITLHFCPTFSTILAMSLLWDSKRMCLITRVQCLSIKIVGRDIIETGTIIAALI